MNTREIRNMTQEEWRLLHANPLVLTASQVPAAVGADRYCTRYMLYHRKKGNLSWPDESLRFAVGHALEPVIADAFARETGYTVRDPGEYAAIQHPAHPWLWATPDIIAEIDGVDIPVEIKTTESFTEAAKSFSTGNTPLQYDVQIQMQMYIMNSPFAYAVCMRGLGSRGLDIVRVERDDELINCCVVAAHQFLGDIAAGREPEPGGTDADSDAIRHLYPADDGGTVTLDVDEWRERLERLEQAKREAKAINDVICEIENQLKAAIGDHTYAVCGDVSFSYRTQERKGYVVQPTIFRALRKVSKKENES